jgi:hypothetical protein
MESVGLLSDTTRSSRRGLPQTASQVAIAAAQAEAKLPKLAQANPQNPNTGDSNRISLQLDLESQGTSAEATSQTKAQLLSPSVGNLTSPRRPGVRKQPLPQIQRIMSTSLQAALSSPSLVSNSDSHASDVAPPPTLTRGMSARATVEASRQALMEMMSQIR